MKTENNYKGNLTALIVLTFTMILSFFAGVEAQKKEMGPVDKVILREYMDSLMTEKRFRDDSWQQWCDPATRVAFKYWQTIQRQQVTADTTILLVNK